MPTYYDMKTPIKISKTIMQAIKNICHIGSGDLINCSAVSFSLTFIPVALRKAFNSVSLPSLTDSMDRI